MLLLIASRCMLFMLLLDYYVSSKHNSTSKVNLRIYRHERSRLRRQGVNEPSVYVIEHDGSPESGEWGPWSAPSPCSRSCGGGVSAQTRSCQPYSSCVGGTRRFFSCNIQECPEGSDFRAEQCAAYNNIPFEGITYDWLPYTKAINKCALNCMPRGERFYYRHKDQVHDGTRCSEEGLDVCVEGKCLPVGCDMLLGSSAREDMCRVCGGDGSTCNIYSGIQTGSNLVPGYNDILFIPRGATNIRIAEKRPTRNYLAIRNEANEYYLNGGWRIDFPRSLRIAGTVFHYQRKTFSFNTPESITALGPTNEPLLIVLLFLEPNPGIEYVYALPKTIHVTGTAGYEWASSDFSECSASCGGGIQNRQIWCKSLENNLEVTENLCDLTLKPSASRKCGGEDCPAQWIVGEFEPCSSPCGPNSTQTRLVYCEQLIGSGQLVKTSDWKCSEVQEKPETTRTCLEPDLCPTWHAGPWKPCDKLCGEGKQRRELHCYRKVDGRIELLEYSECHDEEQPESEKPCNLRPCEGLDWVTSQWSGCDDKCGISSETRHVYCANQKGVAFPDDMCHGYRRPATVRQCTYVPCASQWFASQWSACSAKCGTGIMTRRVLCVTFENDVMTKVDDSNCDSALKYETEKECSIEEECKGEWFAGPYSTCDKPCGGGIRTRKVVCVKNNKTVDTSNCDEGTILFSLDNCNKQPCGEDELMPVEPSQVITEESSEECDYDEDYDYSDEVTDSPEKMYSITEGIIKLTDELEGSGDFSEDIDAVSPSVPPLFKDTMTEEAVSSSAKQKGSTDLSSSSELPSSSSHFSISTDFPSFFDAYSSDLPQDEPVSLRAGTPEESSSTQQDDNMTDSSTAVSGETGMSSSAVTVAASEYDTSTSSDDASSTMATDGSTSSSSLESSTITDSSTTTPDMFSSDLSSQSSTEGSSGEPTTYSSSDATSTSAETSTDSSSVSSLLPSSISVTTSEISSATDLTSESFTGSATESTADSVQTESFSSTVNVLSTELSASTSGVSEVTTSSTDVGSSVSSESSGTTLESTSASEEMTSAVSDMSSVSTLLELTTEFSTDTSYSTTVMTGISEPEVTSEEVTAESEASTTSGSTAVTPEESTGFSTDVTTEVSASGATEVTETDEIEEQEGYSTTSWSEAVFGVTTPSSIEVVVTKEQTLKKCKKKKKRKCVRSEFGCCPDKKTPAKGPFGEGCIVAKTCEGSEFGCCSDKVSPAAGPENKGCPPSYCEQTLFGCCPDGVSASQGNDYEGCPALPTEPPVECVLSQFGCCPDGITSAIGSNFEGCDCEESGCMVDCSNSTFGCCPDGFTSASGPQLLGCDGLVGENETDCSNSTYGCCPDGISSAEGPSNEGCKLCSESVFGCCFDGVTFAKGPKKDGCPPECLTSQFGCCDDNVTMAHGPNLEGCCLNSPFGCCPDNILAAHGPNKEGCDCNYSPYGCCPDNATSALGYDYEGCGCEYSEFGCCPDRRTSALGPNHFGCTCHTFQFGCCPDGITSAKGPREQGCGCRYSEFGCCGDQITAAGADGNCSCADTKFGCCHDGVTDAQGEDFLGCENIPEKRADACSLPRDAGSCRDYVMKWFYDTSYGGCSRFWYGNCGGNGNVFSSREECNSVCVDAKGKDSCHLPKAQTSCQGNYPMWTYDKFTKSCEPFVYGGCLGNNNRFNNRAECEELCITQDHLDPCEQSLEPGPCDGSYPRWYYNKQAETCLPFNYGGCQGTKNRFHTEAACRIRCMKPGTAKEECSLPRAEGNCDKKLAKWYFSEQQNKCLPFYYTGCGGNSNKYDTREECLAQCPVKIEQDTCFLAADTGDCYNYTQRYYFDTLENRCKLFYYGGCGGNGNNFFTDLACQKRCQPQALTEQPPLTFTTDMCYLPSERGGCSESLVRWFYDRSDGVCKQFQYSGCQGNGNQFRTEAECVYSCSDVQDICRLPKAEGNCNDWTEQWYYEDETDTCRRFHFSGCYGNGNRFESLEACETRCRRSRPAPVPEPEPQPEPHLQPEPQPQPQPEPQTHPQPEPKQTFIDICAMNKDPGPCLKQIPSWHYDSATGRCKQFFYGGCEGNANRFMSEEQCERQCGQFLAQDACSSEPEEGTCNRQTTKYYFDTSSRQCQQFVYTGCGGNPNRFSSSEECESICLQNEEPPIPYGENTEHVNEAICSQPLEIGPCDGYIKRWVYDDRRHQCHTFIYSGCAGNLNNFKTQQACIDFCAIKKPQEPNEIDVPVGNELEQPQQPEQSEPETICADPEERCRLPYCQYGIDRWVDTNGCQDCRCHDPCVTSPPSCEPGTACVVAKVLNTDTGLMEFTAICKSDKPAVCPAPIVHDLNECGHECTYDNDCPTNQKCCPNGCGTSCLSPLIEEHVTLAPDYHVLAEPPMISEDTDREVVSEEGYFASLDCVVIRGSPTPLVSWWRGNELINSALSGKYKVLNNGTLQVIGLDKEDAGQYRCTASNEVGDPAHRDIHLTVTEGSRRGPSIMGDDQDSEVVATLDGPTVLRCYVTGWPRPHVAWWRGKLAIPLISDTYQQNRDNSLHVRAVTLNNLGYYTCQAFNGIGSAASFIIALKVYGPIQTFDPNDITYNQFLVPAPDGPSVGHAPPLPAPAPDVPVSASIESEKHEFPPLSKITLDCRASGDPAPIVAWYKDGQPLQQNDAVEVKGNIVIINSAKTEDSGEYKCIASNGLTTHEDKISVLVTGARIPPNCTDSEYFANCALIVQADYCNHKYYAKFCCKSCVEAGKLSIENIHSDRRKRRALLPSRMAKIDSTREIARKLRYDREPRIIRKRRQKRNRKMKKF
ncbi:proteoglycan-like sulfated glycoprotein papilin isoform X1 [Rhodnius prolixus]